MSNEVKFILFTVIPVIQAVSFVLLFVRGLFIRKKRNAAGYSRLVSLSPILLWVGATCGGLFSIPVVLLNPDKMDYSWYIFEVLVLVCIAMLLAYCYETVTYDELNFEASNWLGIKHTYDYGEITGILQKSGDTVLRCGRRRIRLDTMALGGDEFIACADKAFFRRNKRYIPVCKRKIDPMNGNLDTPWFYLFFSIFLFVASVVFLVISISILKPADGKIPAGAIEVHTSFSSYKRTKAENGTLLFLSPNDEKPFSLSRLSGYEITIPDPDTLCNGEEYIVSVCEGEDEYWIYSISTGNHQILISALDHNAAYRNTQVVPCIILQIFVICGTFISIFSIKVGRHPERYSKKFRQLFYKDRAWTPQAKKALHMSYHRKK